MELSVIVPVYNVESFIRPCIESIFRQGLDEDCFEVILIDDGSEDGSLERISDLVRRHANIKLFRQEHQGVSVARNLGIVQARGQYLLLLDSDDLLIDKRLPFLLDKAMERQVDLLVADFVRMSSPDVGRFLSGDLSLPEGKEGPVVEKSGPELFLQDLDPFHCYVWRILYRRDFLLRYRFAFTPGIHYQDIAFCCKAHILARKCLRVPRLLYIYRFPRDGSAVSSISAKKLRDYCSAIAETWELRHTEGLSKPVEDQLTTLVYKHFKSMVTTVYRSIQEPDERMAVLNHLKQAAPDLYFNDNWKQRIVSTLFWRMPRLLLFSFKLRERICNE